MTGHGNRFFLNCQIETVRATIDRKADYLLSAKDNQPALKTDIKEYVRDGKLRSKMYTASTRESGEDRVHDGQRLMAVERKGMDGGKKHRRGTYAV